MTNIESYLATAAERDALREKVDEIEDLVGGYDLGGTTELDLVKRIGALVEQVRSATRHAPKDDTAEIRRVLIEALGGENIAPDNATPTDIATAAANMLHLYRRVLESARAHESTCCDRPIHHGIAVSARKIMPEETRHTAMRGSDVEAWIKRTRDRQGNGSDFGGPWDALDGLLDDYRLHADVGAPLDREA